MNPIKELRQEFGLTQRALAEKAQISPTAVLRYEQGLYEAPSEKIMDVFEEYQPDTSVWLSYHYTNWRHIQQGNAGKYFTELPSLGNFEGEHPFATFRRRITTRAVGKDSRISFCILLAIHPAVVLEYEKCRSRRLPNLIREALVRAYVPEDYINDLASLGEIYHDRING